MSQQSFPLTDDGLADTLERHVPNLRPIGCVYEHANPVHFMTPLGIPGAVQNDSTTETADRGRGV
jgi:hypothetical protein